MRPQRLIRPDGEEGCAHANALMALATLKQAYAAEGHAEGVAAAQDLWDSVSCLRPPDPQ